MREEILRLLDFERRTVIYPGVTRVSERGIVRDISLDGKSAQIVYANCAENEVDEVIQEQVEVARSAGYELEWKLYEHDHPTDLAARLTAAGFEADAKEAFMVLPATKEALAKFGVRDADIRQVTDQTGLTDVQVILEEVRGIDCTRAIEEFRFMLDQHPDNMSLYVAYIDGQPATCGRVYFHKDSQFAGLYGGQTRERFRNRGLFTQIVATRIQEAIRRGVAYVCVDALPTSEPILKKRGFEIMTYTQPFNLRSR